MTDVMEAAVEELQERSTALTTGELAKILTARDDVGARKGSIRNMLCNQSRLYDLILKMKNSDGNNLYHYHPKHDAPGALHTHVTKRPLRCDHKGCREDPTYELALYDGEGYDYRWACNMHQFDRLSNEHGKEIVVTRPRDLTTSPRDVEEA